MAAAILAAGCGSSDSGSSSAARDGERTVTVAWSNEPETLDIQWDIVAVNAPELAGNIYEGLTKLDVDATPQAALAKSWEQVSPTSWKFTLQQGVKFHNGEEFTPEAAVFSITRMLDKDNPNLNVLGTIKKATVSGPDSITIETESPEPAVPREASFLYMVPPDYVKNHLAEYRKKPVGTGPYKSVEHIRGQSATLEANPDYWGGKLPDNSATKVIFKFIPDDSVRVESVRAGESQIANDLSVQHAASAPKVIAREGNTVCSIRLNTSMKPFDNLAVRQAVNYAVDKESIVSSIFDEYAAIPHGQLITAASFGFAPDLTDYPYDEAKAKQLLADSPYDNERIDIVGVAGRYPNDRDVQTATVGYLKKAGFNAELKILPYDLWVENIIGDKKPVALFICSSDDTFAGTKIIGSLATPSGVQSTYTTDTAKKVEAMLGEAATEFDDTKRAASLESIWTLIRDDAGFIPLVAPQTIFGTTPEVSWEPRYDQLLNFREITVGG